MVHPVGAAAEGLEDPKQLGMAARRHMMAHAFLLRLGISLSSEALRPSLSRLLTEATPAKSGNQTRFLLQY